MKFYLIAGEASGDLHGSNLIKALRELYPNAEFIAWGGDLMAMQGAKLVKHYRDLAFMGFVEVIQNLKTILGNIKYCKQHIAQIKPDVVIFIDYPGFNLRLAPFIKTLNIPIIYYISPQIWAWKQSRVETIRKYIDRVVAILPFEQAFYAKFGVEIDYVGHPLLDALSQYTQLDNQSVRSRLASGDNRPVVALLPGSRKQEIKVMLPVMGAAAKKLGTGYQFVVAGAPSVDPEFYRKWMLPEMRLVQGETYPLLSIARGAMVTSGTATLETALFKVPQVVCYKGSTISYHIARRVIRVKYISLVNLILDRPAVTELIQSELTPAKLSAALKPLLSDTGAYRAQLSSYTQLAELLGGGGASNRAAEAIKKHLDQR